LVPWRSRRRFPRPIFLWRLYVPLVTEVAARNVPVVTAHPGGAWITQQGRTLVMDPARGRLPPFPVPDRDAGFTTAFDEIPASEGLEMAETPPAAQRCRRRGRDVRLGSADSGLAQSLGQLSDQPVCFRPPYCQLSGRESRQLLRGRHARHAGHTWQ
jgi:hypothetical protein